MSASLHICPHSRCSVWSLTRTSAKTYSRLWVYPTPEQTAHLLAAVSLWLTDRRILATPTSRCPECLQDDLAVNCGRTTSTCFVVVFRHRQTMAQLSHTARTKKIANQGRHQIADFDGAAAASLEAETLTYFLGQDADQAKMKYLPGH